MLGQKTHFFGVRGGIIFQRDDATIFLPQDGGLDALVGSWDSSEFGFVEPTSDVSSGEILHAIQGHPVATRSPPAFFHAKHFLRVVASVSLLEDALAFE